MAIIRLGSQNSAYLIFRRQLHVPFKHHIAVHIHGQCFDAYAQLLDELGQPGVLLEQDKGIGVESGENEKVLAYPDQNHQRLRNQEHRWPEKSRKLLCFTGEPVFSEEQTEMLVRSVESKIIARDSGTGFSPIAF
jgi:hypothetical protein